MFFQIPASSFQVFGDKLFHTGTQQTQGYMNVYVVKV